MAEVRAVSPAQVQDAASRLGTALLDTKRWDQTSWMDVFNQGTPEQRMIEDSREQAAQQWIGVQRATVQRYVDLVLGVDPQWFHDHAAACSSAESLIRLSVGGPPATAQHDAQPFLEAVAAVDRNLGSWQGAGAEAFKGQVQRIRNFDEQQGDLTVQLGLTMVAGRDAVQAARAGFVAVCENAIGAANAFRGEESAREGRVALYIVVGVAATVLGAVTAGLAPGAVGLATFVFSAAGGGAVALNQTISTGNTVLLTSIPSPDLDSVTAGLARQLDQVAGNLDDEMSTIANRCAAFSGQYATPNLLVPLPPITDVHAPDYTYSDLRSADLSPGPAVDAAVRGQAARAAPPNGRIGRALDPDR